MMEKPRILTQEAVESSDTPSHLESTTLPARCSMFHQAAFLQSAEETVESAPHDPTIGKADDDESCSSSTDFVAIESLLDRGILSLEECDRLLGTFRDMSSYFPFVVIHPKATFQSMIQGSPVLLLAMLASASVSDKPLQMILDEEFRTTVSQMVVLHGEKSLDILQSLLVYIAWFVILYGVH